jgi:hypothetical protein
MMDTVLVKGMRRAVGAASGIVACFMAVQTAGAQQASIADLKWIAGSWSTAMAGQTVEEHWTEPASNALIGIGRTLADGRMVFFEFLRIEAKAGGVFYIAQPNGGAPTEFRLTGWDGRTAMFENPQHDFPKRISYTKNDDGSITARVDGGAGVQQGVQTFAYRRKAPVPSRPPVDPAPEQEADSERDDDPDETPDHGRDARHLGEHGSVGLYTGSIDYVALDVEDGVEATGQAEHSEDASVPRRCE